jgi:hypothetical protein
MSNSRLDLLLGLHEAVLLVALRIANFVAHSAFLADARSSFATAHLAIDVRRISPCFPTHFLLHAHAAPIARGSHA